MATVMPDINSQQLNTGRDRRERRAQKKAAIEDDARKARRKTVLKKTGFWVAGLAVIFAIGWLLVNVTGPKEPDRSQGIPILGREHIADGTVYTSYNSNPPTSGPHYAVPAPARFYDRELPDEQVVHNLEHGHIWIAYRPSLPKDAVNMLKDFSGGNIIVTPRSQNDADIALAAWGRLDKFNVEGGIVDKQRIKDFISRYQNKGPENISVQDHLR